MLEVRKSVLIGKGGRVPLRLKDLRPHNSKLRYNAHNIQMRSVRKEKIPKAQHLG